MKKDTTKDLGQNSPLPLGTTKETIQNLLEKQRMVFIDLQLTLQEKMALKGLEVNVEGLIGNFLYWGRVNDKELSPNLELYLGTIGKNSDDVTSTISRLIIRVVESITEYFDTKYAWIETKTFLANDTFKTPRWHVDDKFFKPYTVYKLVWGLKGAQTRFGVTDKIVDFQELTALEIQAGHGTEENIRVREKLDQIVDKIEIPDGTNATLYQSGGDDPVIHSEPNMSENRLFLAVVPGTKEDISRWHERKRQKDIRKQVTERRWCYHRP